MKELLILTLIGLLVITETFAKSVDVFNRRNNGCGRCAIQKLYPQENDRIAIIGAGPAGIHMAYKLQNLGYNDITVFEKTDRVGGKSYTYEHKGTNLDMGTIYATPEYTELFSLLDEFNTSRAIPALRPYYWTDIRTNYTGLTYQLSAIAKEYGIVDPTIALGMLANATRKYFALHRQLFSVYEGELFPRPGPDVLHKTRGTFMDFLTRNDIAVLKYIFISSHTIQGYGQLDEISALYGLMWNTPLFIQAILNPAYGITVLDNGFEDIWRTIVDERKIKVIYNAEITSIKRSGRVSIRYYQECQNNSKLSIFDFLIVSGNLKEIFSDTIKDPSVEELRIFNKLVPVYFTTTIAESEFGLRSSSPINYYIFVKESEADHNVSSTFEKYGVLKGYLGENYTLGLYPGNAQNEYTETVVYYQSGKDEPSTDLLDEKINYHAASLEKRNLIILKRITWVYFPRFTPAEMTSGILWDILDMQGYKNTWYIGSSVCFESLKSVLEYNKLLLRKFNMN